MAHTPTTLYDETGEPTADDERYAAAIPGAVLSARTSAAGRGAPRSRTAQARHHGRNPRAVIDACRVMGGGVHSEFPLEIIEAVQQRVA